MSSASKTSKFFEELVDQLDLLLTFGYQPAAVLTYGMEGVRRMRAARERKWRRETMRRLEKRQVIKLLRAKNGTRISLTEKGAVEVLRMKMSQADELPSGVVCLVTFDIPEAKKKTRDQLRFLLCSLGFAPLQKSVWISPFDVAVPLERFFATKQKAEWSTYRIRVFTAHDPNLMVDTETSRSRRK